MPNNTAATRWQVVGVLLALALVVAIVLLIRRARPTPQPALPHVLSLEDRLRLVQLKNLGTAHLENERYAEAEAELAEVTELLADELLGPRNLVITRLLALKASSPEQKAQRAVEAHAALDELMNRQADSDVAHVLAAKLADALADADTAVREQTRATELAPQNPAAWYQLYQLTKDSPDEATADVSKQALERAYRLQPQNLVLLSDWLLVQAEAEEAGVVETLAAARTALRWLFPTMRQQGKTDPAKLIDDAAEAARIGNWPVVETSARILGNLTRGLPAAQSDRRRLDPHEMQYIIHDFSPAFYAELEQMQPTDQAAIEVKFVPAALEKQLPALRDARDIVLEDFDADGRIDAVVVRDGSVEVYGRADGADEWQRIMHADLPPGLTAVLVADFDWNAELDLVLYGPAGVRLMRHTIDAETKARTLQEHPEPAELGELGNVLAALAADLDHDGDLDLVVSAERGISIWSNRGDMTFVEISERSDLPPAGLRATALAAVDWDRDADIDVIVSGAGAAGWLENVQHGQFRWRAFDEPFGALRSAAGLAVLDADGDVSWDVAAAGSGGVAMVRTETPHPGVVRFLDSTGVSAAGRHAVLTGDFDNDGYLDLAAWDRGRIEIFRGRPRGKLAAAPWPSGLDPDEIRDVRSCAVGDVDGDGDLDLAVAEAGRVVWLANEGGNRNHWLAIQLRAAEVKDVSTTRVNHFGRGSLVEVRAGRAYQPRVVTGRRTHFGLGQRETADVVRVLWTNGVPQNVLQPKADATVHELQVLKGSCPYVYTWTGSKFEFFTDCLWAAPLGLQLAEGVFAPSRAWEYLTLPGDRLRPRDGEYWLQMTEELWEAAYLDQVELIAVDHPADVAVYSNEKVGPAEIAAFGVHTVRNPREPAAARDQRGRDVLDKIRSRDGSFLKAFDRKLCQGLTEEHWLELDLGPLDRPQRITLFLTGWIYPTDTSINVALSQNPASPRPQPPALWVPDADGQWREVVPFMGFPGGKTKTIAVDVSKCFLTDDYRLRVVTNMEFYWDAAFFTVDEEPAPIQLTPLELQSADLRYRGFSERLPGTNFGPENYDYDRVTTAPKWPPMEGRFTRYGDVTELVNETDDRLVVFGAGDELTLRFAAPAAELPAGWQRDFLLHNVGWDKDADLNTVYGQTVEPLPFGSMSGYPYRADESYPADPRLQAYIEQYQTRTQNRAQFWNSVARPPQSPARKPALVHDTRPSR